MIVRQISCLIKALDNPETFANAVNNLRRMARKYPQVYCEYLAARIKKGEFSQNDSGDRRIFLIFLIEGKEQHFVEMLSVMLNHSPKMIFLLRLIAEKVLAVSTESSLAVVVHCRKMATEKSKINPQLREIADLLNLAEGQLS